MDISQNNIASIVGAGVKNTQFQAGAAVMTRRILILGTYDPLLTVTENIPQAVTSAEDIGARYGFGTMIHRLGMRAFAGAQGVSIDVSVQDESVGAVAASGKVVFAGTATSSGVIPMYFAGDRIPVNVSIGQTPAQIATDLVAAMAAVKELSISSAVDGVVPEEVDFTAKSKGPFGNDISIEVAYGPGEIDTMPSGVTVTITGMSGGSGIPVITTALTNLGTGDLQNENHYTDVVHGYGDDTTTLDALSTYNGIGNDFVGNYSKTVARPFRSLIGDTTSGSAGYSALLAFTANRKLDRTSGVIAAPGSISHPQEIAAYIVADAAYVASIGPETGSIGRNTPFYIGATGDRWTDDYALRDNALKNGIGTTSVENGVLVVSNLATFYRPDSVPVASNGYRRYRDIAIIQNILYSIITNFKSERWKGFTVVEDTGKISNTTAAQKARDIDSVIADYVALATSWEGLAWIYSRIYTIKELQKSGSVSVRLDGSGFDSIVKIVLSGEGGILNNQVNFDINLAVFTR